MPSSHDRVEQYRAKRRSGRNRMLVIVSAAGVCLVGVVLFFAFGRGGPTGGASVPDAVFRHARQWTDAVPRYAGYEPVRGRRGADAQDFAEAMATAGNLDGKLGDRNSFVQKHDAAAKKGVAPGTNAVPKNEPPAFPKSDDRVDGAYLVEFERPVAPLPGSASRWWVYLMTPDGKVSLFFPADRDGWRDEIKRHMVP